VRENVRFAKALDASHAKGSHPLLEAAIGAHAPFTLGDETLADLAGACGETARGLHIHAGEDSFDAVDSRYRHGCDLAVRLDRAGLLGSRTILAHGLFLSREEVDLVNDRGCFLAHNAKSNMNNVVGYNGLLPLHKKVVLGTDGIGSDMLGEAMLAFFKHRDQGGTLWMDSFLEMMQNGNKLIEAYFSGKKFGRVEPGFQADLTFWDYDSPTPLLGENIAGHAAFGMSSRMVRSTMVAGKYVVKDRRPLFDSPAVMAGGREQSLRLWKNMEAL
jgi:cytosine/adenosine deaminase-related metal-dependent hydrolase